MKRKEVFLGFILAAFMGSAGIVDAQTNANYQNASMIEIGPDNIGGRARALLAVPGNNNEVVLYAGSVAGGLYKRTGNAQWEYVPYFENGTEVTLPISDMVLASNNKIYIATGEGYYNHAVNYNLFAPMGHGIFEYDMASNTITAVANTDPRSNSAFSYINRLAYMDRDGRAYLYVGTTTGLYLMTGNSGEALGIPTKVCDGAVQDIELIPSLNIGFFSMGSTIHKIGNIKDRSTTETMMTNSAVTFGDSAARIELAVAYSNNRMFLYAVATDKAGLTNGVFLTHDQQTWMRLTTSTVLPFNANTTGWTNNSVAVDPFNHSRILVGGATLWEGQGYVEGAYYLWNKISYSENELNGGDFMGTVYFNPQYLHSGINAIVPYIYDTANYGVTYYLATDGGIFSSNGRTFSSLNNGFNTVQFNNIAVAPDGSLLGGAVKNAVPLIQSRMNHDGGNVNNSWYDHTSRLNHMANIAWQGSGSDVATTMFQQVVPQERRGIFVSSDNGVFGRSYADYNDYTNAQTWTYGAKFTTDQAASSSYRPRMVMWETTTNTNWNDSVEFTLDTLGTYIAKGGEVKPLRGNAVIQAGDTVLVPSPAHFDYPFKYAFTKSFTVKNQMNHKVHNPIANRLFIVSKFNNGTPQVLMTCSPSDYHKVYDIAYAEPTWMRWYTVFQALRGDKYHDTLEIRQIAVSNDCDALFLGMEEPSTGKSRIYRVSNISAANVGNTSIMAQQLSFNSEFVVGKRITVLDTFFKADGSYEFDRPITSLTVDKRNSKDVLVATFGGYVNNNQANVVVISNATTDSYAIRELNCSNSEQGFSTNDPVYSALIEYTKGNVLIGTEKGVFKADAITGTPTWKKYGDFKGVPVTSIVQQTAALPSVSYVRHNGINPVTYCFAKTKYPYAIYYGTYGRGIFMDTSYVTDHENEIVDTNYWTGITTVTKGTNSVRVYPNPAVNEANVEIMMASDANVVVRVFDISGHMVYSEKLGKLAAGVNNYKLDCTKLAHGMYLINVVSGSQAAASKLIVK